MLVFKITFNKGVTFGQIKNYTKLPLRIYKASHDINNTLNMIESKARTVPKGVDFNTFLDTKLHNSGISVDSIKNCQIVVQDNAERMPYITEKLNLTTQYIQSGGCLSKSPQIPSSQYLFDLISSVKNIAKTFNSGSLHYLIKNKKLLNSYELEYVKCSDAFFDFKVVLNKKLTSYLQTRHGPVIRAEDGSSLYFMLKDFINQSVINTHNCFVIEKDGILYFFTMTSNKNGPVQLLFNGSSGIDQYVRTDAIVIPSDCVIFCNVSADPTQNLGTVYNSVIHFENSVGGDSCIHKVFESLIQIVDAL